MVRLRRDRGVTWVSLNRPDKHNALSPALNDAMLSTLVELETDPDTEVLVLTGEGEAFSSGMDLKEYFRETDDDPARAEHARWVMRQWAYYRLRRFPKPTIAAVNGWCFGGAFTPLVSCDLAVASEDATFGLSEVNWGILPAGSVTWDVAQVMSYRDALYYILTGKSFDARRAVECGLVNEAVPADRLAGRVTELARDLQRLNPAVLRSAKEAFLGARELSYEAAYDYLRAKFVEMQARDVEQGRGRALEQFLDRKSFRPGLEPYDRGGAEG
ncbi:MAG: p-hydroxycinnamoyl CoA hydratase/lyase [Acidimicrobiales bacterium]